MKGFKKRLLFTVFCFRLLFAYAQTTTVSDFERFFATAQLNGKPVAVIRKYVKNNNIYFITVNFDDLKVKTVPDSSISPVKQTWQSIVEKYNNTAYIKAIKAAQNNALALQDAGIMHGNKKSHGITLTIDLCPSHKPLDRDVFTAIFSAYGKIKTPQAIGISITGKFLASHRDDLLWLHREALAHNINIAWINHTYNHFYNPKLPLQHNFLLEKGTNLDFEILQLEKTLLEQNWVFSPFFRFPGLVSDSALVHEITEYGLIPIGTDAWLAKGQLATNGSIVLIHANGNEPVGVQDFIALLKQKHQAINSGQWMLFDLRQTVEDDVNNNQ